MRTYGPEDAGAAAPPEREGFDAVFAAWDHVRQTFLACDEGQARLGGRSTTDEELEAQRARKAAFDSTSKVFVACAQNFLMRYPVSPPIPPRSHTFEVQSMATGERFDLPIQLHDTRPVIFEAGATVPLEHLGRAQYLLVLYHHAKERLETSDRPRKHQSTRSRRLGSKKRSPLKTRFLKAFMTFDRAVNSRNVHEHVQETYDAARLPPFDAVGKAWYDHRCKLSLTSVKFSKGERVVFVPQGGLAMAQGSLSLTFEGGGGGGGGGGGSDDDPRVRSVESCLMTDGLGPCVGLVLHHRDGSNVLSSLSHLDSEAYDGDTWLPDVSRALSERFGRVVERSSEFEFNITLLCQTDGDVESLLASLQPEPPARVVTDDRVFNAGSEAVIAKESVGGPVLTRALLYHLAQMPNLRQASYHVIVTNQSFGFKLNRATGKIQLFTFLPPKLQGTLEQRNDHLPNTVVEQFFVLPSAEHHPTYGRHDLRAFIAGHHDPGAVGADAEAPADAAAGRSPPHP